MKQKDDVKWELQVIFIYYTSYADRNNFRYLKQQNYRRFLIDSDTIKKQSSLVHFDIAFQKISHSAIIFKDFLALIPDIAELVYKKSNRSEAFKIYIKNHIQPLFTEILHKSEFGQDISTMMQVELSPKIEKSFKKNSINEKIFMKYIGATRHAKDVLQIFQTFNTFLKEFELSPELISKSMAYVIFLYIIRDESLNEVFGFNDYLKSLMYISEIAHKKLMSSDLCEIGKMSKVLERMQISEGFERISKTVVCETAITPSILRGFLEANKDSDHCRDNAEVEFSRVFPSSTRHKNCNSSFGFSPSKEKLKKSNYNSVRDAISQQSASFSKESREIKQTFEELCSFGEVANTKTLKSFKIKKLYDRTKLITAVSKPWLDIQIVNLQRSSGTGKMEFPQFLELLSLTAKKLDVPMSDICSIILNDRNETNKSMMEQSGIQHQVGEFSESDQHILKGILSQAEKQLDKIYCNYAIDQRLMNFTELTKCMYDLQIFPSILSKNRMFQIFSALSDVREQNESVTESQLESGTRVKTLEHYLKDEKKIEFSGFLLGVIEMAQDICDSELAAPQKLIVLLEKINDTKAYKAITSTSLVGDVRKKFGKYYEKSFKKVEKTSENFDELLEGLY